MTRKQRLLILAGNLRALATIDKACGCGSAATVKLLMADMCEAAATGRVRV